MKSEEVEEGSVGAFSIQRIANRQRGWTKGNGWALYAPLAILVGPDTAKNDRTVQVLVMFIAVFISEEEAGRI